MNCFHPDGIYVWDTWYYEHNGEIHCTFLQQARPGHPERNGETGALGHAVSKDLVHWEHRPSVLYPGKAGSYDDGDLWTGCTFLKDGRRYMYYTANHRIGDINDSSIGLAVSDDGINYVRHPESPVIRCNPELYASYENQIRLIGHGEKLIDCRDLCVVKDPDGDGYYGYFAARVHSDSCAASSVIALAYSHDLVHWEQRKPCFIPDRYGCVEVPDVFFLDGKWWMLCLTGNMYGQRYCTGQPDWSLATIQACADSPEGPFTEVFGHEILGSVNWQGFCSKTLQLNGKRYVFHTQGEDVCCSHFGSIGLPAELVRTGDHLSPMWCEQLENMKTGLIFSSDSSALLENDGRWGTPGIWNSDGGSVTGYCPDDWSIRLYDTDCTDCIIEATVTPECEAAGIVLRAEGKDCRAGAYVVLLDTLRGEVWFTATREFPVIEKKKISVECKQKYDMKIIACGDIFYVFVNGVRCLQLFCPGHSRGKIGYYTERGTAGFGNLSVFSID